MVFPGLTVALDSAVFDSVFLIVTGAFDCAAADSFAAVLDKEFAPDFAGAAGALTAVLAVGLALDFASALLGDFLAVRSDSAAIAFFTAGFPFDLSAVDLAAAGLAFCTTCVEVFADFFIALAMESKPLRH